MSAACAFWSSAPPDFSVATSAPADWAAALDGIDAVVNCAGILQSRATQSAHAIHAAAPIALFDACVARGVRQVVQISAVSADDAAGTEYARTKKAADDHLRGLDLAWIVLRPSLVYGQGSFGGTSLLRGLAGLPWVTPLIGDGGQMFQPIHVDDLAEVVARCLRDPGLARRGLEPAGPEALSARQILALTRGWLDLPPTLLLPVPMQLVRLGARLGDVLDLGPLCSTAIAQMEYGYLPHNSDFAAAVGFQPRSMAQAFAAAPSHVQDRWHARLYFLNPLLTVALVLLWLGSGLAGLIHLDDATLFARQMGLPAGFAWATSVAFSVFDLMIAVALAFGWKRSWLGPVQLLLVGGYTLGLGVALPSLWLDPLGRLLKNLPVLAAIAVWVSLQDER